MSENKTDELYQKAGRNLLGAMLHGTTRIVEKAIRLLTPSHFIDPDQQLLFTIIQDTYKKNGVISIPVIEKQLLDQGISEDHLHEHLFGLSVAPGALKCDGLIELLMERYQRIIAAQMADEIKAVSTSPHFSMDDVFRITDTYRNNQNVTTDNVQTTALMPLLINTYDSIADMSLHPDKRIQLPTGFAGIDALTDGLSKGEMHLIGARPGVGKSTFVLQLAMNLLQFSNATIWMYFLEESQTRTGLRILSNVSGIDSGRLAKGMLTNKECVALHASIASFENESENRLTLIHTTILTPGDIRSRLMHARAKGRLPDVIIIDHLGIMQGDKTYYSTQQVEISDLSQQVCRLAKDFDVAMVACAQLNRGITDREDKRPMMSDLRGSGSLEQDASTILLLHRDQYFNHSAEPNHDSFLDVYVEKNRYGRLGMTRLSWDPQRVRVSDID